MHDTRYPGLDGLRGLAAFLVVLHHTALKGSDIGGLSVFLFFTLSGFLITGILARARREIEAGRTSGGRALIRFWTQRALRIFPAYYLWLAALLPFDLTLFDGKTAEHLGWYLLYAQNFLIGFVTHVWQDFTHTWSLAVEQQYYLLFPLAVLALPSRRQEQFFIVAISACLLCITALTALGYEQITLYTMPSTGFVFMAAGGYLAIIKRERLAFLACPAVVLATLALITLLALYPFAERNNVARVPYVFLVIGSAAALAALTGATLAAPLSWPVRVLEAPTPKFLGKISYSLYIVHLPLAYWVQESSALAAFGRGFGRDLAETAIVLPTSIALAALSYACIETPFLRLKAQLKK